MSKVKKQTAKKLPRQIKCVKMMSEPLTDEQNAIMQVAMKTRLPVQNEIVRILDMFTGLTAELNAELDARKKQYEFYRNALLNTSNAKSVRLDEICNIQNGYTPSKKNNSYWKNESFPWFRMDDIRENGRILSDSIQHVTDKAVKGNGFPADSIIFSTSATIGEHALIKTPFICNQRFTVINIKESLKNSIDVKYLFYYGFIIGKLCIGNAKDSGTFKSVQTNAFKSFKIMLPDITTQKKVVNILDDFDKLSNSITDGLPA